MHFSQRLLAMSALCLRLACSTSNDFEEIFPIDSAGRFEPADDSKVDRLGAVLKRGVSRLRSQGRVDLVFLVDSSASVGAQNFYNEIKFIRKLLADFAVSAEATRVVIVTFSSVDKVIRQVDHVTPNATATRQNKCSLLEVEIPAISYASGGTYTLGALNEALLVLGNPESDPAARRSLFLITDGYSNGGDPRPAANALKHGLGVELFTFGIRNGNVKELRAMASEPVDEHCFILDSFEEFEALARRALHEDLPPGEFVAQDSSACAGICDSRATCSCGTHTGQYRCICPPGYFGFGRNVSGDGCLRKFISSAIYNREEAISLFFSSESDLAETFVPKCSDYKVEP